MNLHYCIMTNSKCYKESTQGAKYGIIVHSTGANNPYIKRYVQPSDEDPSYNEIIEDLGKNIYKNDWNHNQVNKGVHAFIGKNIKNEIATYRVMPYTINAWGVAAGTKGSVNYGDNARIQFEICEDNLANEEYFTAAMQEAIQFCAALCHEYGWTSANIWSHKEAIKNGYGSGGHVDIDHWLAKYDKDMDWFREMVEDEFNHANNEFLSRETFLVGQKIYLRDYAKPYGSDKKLPKRLFGKSLYVRDVQGDVITVSRFRYGLLKHKVARQFCIK